MLLFARLNCALMSAHTFHRHLSESDHDKDKHPHEPHEHEEGSVFF